MTIVEAMKSGKLVRRANSKHPEYGTIVENDDGTTTLVVGNKVLRLGIMDIVSDDWEAKREARTFWLGLKTYKHIHYGTGKETEHKFMMAVEGEKAPEDATDDGKPWAKAVEILDES